MANKKTKRNPSEIIQDFIDLMEQSHAEYASAKSKVEYFNKRTYTWTHDLEDAPNKAERNKLATAWQKELRQRRIEKDRMRLWEKLHKMGIDVQSKSFMKKLRHLLVEQVKTEEYISTPYEAREYNGRVVDEDDTD